jgi:hypothetical protein
MGPFPDPQKNMDIIVIVPTKKYGLIYSIVVTDLIMFVHCIYTASNPSKSN